MSTHTISILVENHSGALSRIAGLFSSRGYNISSLAVAETEDPTLSRMTIVVAGDESVLEQVVKQLNRLVDVVKVLDFAGEEILDRELLLIRLDSGKSTRHEIISLVEVFGGKIAAAGKTSMTVEISGTSAHLNDFVAMVRPYGIKDLVRTGKVAIARPKR